MKLPWLTVGVVAVVVFLWKTDAQPDESDKAPTPSADPMRGKKAGDVRDDNDLKMKLVWLPPGEFAMRQEKRKIVSPANEFERALVKVERIPVNVLVTRGYWLGKYEVTQSEWKQIMATEPWKGESFTKEGDDFPTSDVNWDDAMEFCRKVTERERRAGRLPEGWEYSLPTEAQWEWGCRAGTDTKFSFGDDESKLGQHGWFYENAARWRTENFAHRVGLKKSNPWGLYDMHGNVSEWCRDWHSDKVSGGRDPEVTERPTGKMSYRVVRGGGFGNNETVCESANRSSRPPSRREYDLGFRVALSPSGNK